MGLRYMCNGKMKDNSPNKEANSLFLLCSRFISYSLKENPHDIYHSVPLLMVRVTLVKVLGIDWKLLLTYCISCLGSIRGSAPVS